MGEIDNAATFIRLKEKEQKAKFYTEEEWLRLLNAAHLIDLVAELLHDSLLVAYG